MNESRERKDNPCKRGSKNVYEIEHQVIGNETVTHCKYTERLNCLSGKLPPQLISLEKI